MAIDDRTLHRDYPKPNADNLLQDDAPRLRDALDAIDADVYAKLDTAAYTPENTLAQIASVDGDGSGLDADLLDGIHASGFSLSSHTHTAATTSAAGFLSASDKAKIDGIAAGAQVNTVTSVNSKTGTVVLTATDVGAIDASGISSPVDGQALVYDAATGKWVNGSGTGNAKALAFFFSSF